MTPHDLLAAFETLADAPDGIARLRELILQLAVRGKLVPQDPDDEPASVLLERIAAEKARLAKEGRIAKGKVLPPVREEEVPFAVPPGWVWARTQDLTLMVTDGDHVPPPKSDSGIPFAVIGNLSSGVVNLTDTRHVPLDYYESLDWSRKPMKGDLLYTVTGSFGIVVPVDIDTPFCVQRHVGILKTSPMLSNSYLRSALASPASREFAASVATGIAQKTVPLSGLRKFPIPLPPLAEQHRIVARVDALMALLDRLEATRNECESTRVALRDATLAALRDAPDAEAVEAAWRRVAERMDDLFTDPADVAPLRQTILQLAVRGKLVPQDPDDEPASVLLERTAAEKARLVQEGKIARPKALPPVREEEIPFAVPPGWIYVRLNDLLIEDSRNGLAAQPNQIPPGTEILRISASTARQDAIVMEEDHRFLELEEKIISTYELKRGDLLACRFNGNLHYVGRIAIYEQYSGHRQVYPDKLIRFRMAQSFINPWYVRFAMNCQAIRFVIENMCTTTAGNIGINATNLKTVAIPLPPLAEQHRIVARVEALMALCEALEARLAAARQAQAAFAAAAVHHLDV